MRSSLGEGWSRLRYRRAELRRIAPSGVTPEGEAAGDSPRWVCEDGARDGTANVLVLPAGARIAYRVTLPDHARVITRCDYSVELPFQTGTEIEFTIQAVFAAGQSRHSCRIAAGGGGRTLCLTLEHGGPATLVLATRVTAGPPVPRLPVRWSNPRVEWPRPSRDLVVALGKAVRHRSVGTLGRGNEARDAEQLYRLWVRENQPSAQTLRDQRQRAAEQGRAFTLITLPRAGVSGSKRTLNSLLDQSYPHWEWLLVTEERERLWAADVARDPRVRLIAVDPAMSPAARINRALAGARGEFAGLLDHGDLLDPSALFEMAQAARPDDAADVLYSDEDRVSAAGVRFQPTFKPDWSPELLLSCNYVGRLAFIRIATAIAAGGVRDGFGQAHEWELLLRLSRSGARFRRVVGCFYHRHEAAPATAPDERDAVLLDHGKALGLTLHVDGPPTESRLRWTLEHPPVVSVIIPNRNAFPVLKKCVDGILDRTRYPNRELIIVDNGSTDRDVLDLYARLEREGRGRIVPFDRPFNFSAACNAGAAAANGELLLFLNNDIEVVDPDWMEEMVRWARRPGIGVVGAQLLYPDRMIQHAGVVFGLGLVGHIFGRAAEHTRGVFGSSDWYRNYMAVTGACQMLPRDVFERLGGYDERLRLSFSDVMLCMEAGKAGYRVVYTPHARLIHHESFTRQKEDSAEDMELFARYLRRENFVEDPYLHPDLDPRSLIPVVRPPFGPLPRQVIADFLDRVLAASALR